MTGGLLALPIEASRVLVPVYVVAAVLVVALLLPLPGVRARLRVWWPIALAAAGVGALVGSLLVWLVLDVQDAFGVPASTVIRGAAAAAGAGVGLAVGNLVRTRWWRKVVAVVAIPVVLIAGGLMINRDVAYFPRLGDALGLTGVSKLSLAHASAGGVPLRDWTPPAGMPSSGTVGTVDIPGLQSHWNGRPAWVYEPPAAHTAHPPRLPVVIAFSGEPGGPSDVFIAGGLQAKLDAIAKAHKGVAPIVVVPDQLGSFRNNPMCLDSPLGHVATYVTSDVRTWVERHLPVSTDRRDWTVAGFSEGATCAVQFASAHPELFGSFLAISPELGPIDHGVAHTVKEAFHGSLAAFRAAQPIAIMQRHAPYAAMTALYCVGGRDKRYGAILPKLVTASERAGMRTQTKTLPGVAHNWNTGADGFAWGLPRLVSVWGLP
ncbi:MAG TPA: alpha/beta hydrolase-fold protein [Amnibacterium sp.]|uniref:alpha/beta hydrolase n=1 Tax=Amnibacterium sp. TaxID=1872496 RepID=UPI002F95D44A